MKAEDEKYWVLMSRYLSNELSSDETDELLLWIEQDPSRTELLQELQSSWDKAVHYKDYHTQYFDVERAWQKVSLKIDEKEKPKTVINLSWLRYAAIIIALLNVCWFSFKYFDNRKQIRIENMDGQVKLVNTPDGSVIWLNNRSKLIYQKGMANLNERVLKLEGEAFFEVAPDKEKPFIVFTSNTETKVLGTSFNIKHQHASVIVSVVTGKVSFQPIGETKERMLLLPNEAGTYSRQRGMLKTMYANKNFLFWKNHQLSFENERFKNVIASIEENYQVKIHVQNNSLLDRQITSTFKESSFEEVRQVLEALLDCKIEKVSDNKTYIVY